MDKTDGPSQAQPDESSPSKPLLAYVRNWVTLYGLLLTAASFFAFIFLFVLDVIGRTSNPYVGVLTYMVAPMFSAMGLGVAVLGMLLAKYRVVKVHGKPLRLAVDLTNSRHRKYMGVFVTASLLFLLVTALGSYYSYHFTESVSFCGQTCHTVMEPEFVTYSHSPHARVGCVECHIGPGAEWFVKAKISGLYQVYAVALDKYPRPVPTPIHNLRPARDTCEQCHWPEKFSGSIVRNYRHYLSDRENTEFGVRMLLHVGGSNPNRGRPEGIHWHISPNNKVEFIATDPQRQVIPWVRLTQPSGSVEFRSPSFTNDISGYEIRTMDCLDCHNRPAHRYKTPNQAVDLAITEGRLDRAMPFVRSNAVWVLVQNYLSVSQAEAKIAELFARTYPGEPRATNAVAVVQQIYRENFFPEMKASWKNYPEFVGHKDWIGCFRCHDDRHATNDKSRTIKFTDCSICHTIVSQGDSKAMQEIGPAGQSFKHPGEPYDPAFFCSDCHNGGN